MCKIFQYPKLQECVCTMQTKYIHHAPKHFQCSVYHNYITLGQQHEEYYIVAYVTLMSR